MKQELQEHWEIQQAQDGEISELKAMIQTLIEHVKGKGMVSSPMPAASGAGGGNLPPPSWRLAAGHQAEEETPMINGKGLGGRKERVRKEDEVRDQHLGHKPTMRQGMTNSLQSYHESWPTPWDNGQEYQRNPLPYLRMRSTKILAYAYYHANITTTEISGSSSRRPNESNTP